MRGQSCFHQSALIFRAKTYGLYFFGTLMLCVLCSCSKKEPASISQETSPVSSALLTSDFKYQLNDTGITWGGDYPQGIKDGCSAKINQEMLPDGERLSGDILSQQDCWTGKDAKSSDTAFQYQKLDDQGQPLDTNATKWQCVLDKKTGLSWEIKEQGDGKFASSGLHDADDVFMWYSGNHKNNGGSVGKWNADFAHCDGYVKGQPATYCNSGEFISRLNQQKLCGFNDWRLPSLSELNGLIHYGRTMPAIDTEFFPNTQNQYYWSSTPHAGNTKVAWAVSFQFGSTSSLSRDNPRPIRAVRSSYATK